MKEISQSTRSRLPQYLTYLREIAATSEAASNISSAHIAEALRLGEIQVRKDLAAVSGAGRPRIGYIIAELIDDLEDFLGYNNISDAVVVGCGKLGRAILGYEGFSEYGLNIAAGFDTDFSKTGLRADGKEIMPMEKLTEYCLEKNIKVGILTVPAPQAQAACDRMIEAGIRAISNFSPVHICVPQGIILKNEDIASSIAELSKRLAYNN
ncbi:MAG: redox-sensing transcriptional repressor Rex [Clostridia bacterium]|nr:redox-sensing transcriptional repressor Rex [Clostridia bacterium]